MTILLTNILFNVRSKFRKSGLVSPGGDCIAKCVSFILERFATKRISSYRICICHTKRGEVKFLNDVSVYSKDNFNEPPD